MVMSDDNAALEVGPIGNMVDITAAMAMACTAGFGAAEAVAAVSFTCTKCGVQKIGMSSYVLHEVTEKEHVHWCRQCYSNSCRDDPAENRAWRKRGDEEKDK